MRWLETRIPPPVVAACFAILVWLVAPHSAQDELPLAYRLGTGLFIALLGGAIAAAGSVGFRRARTTVNPLRPERASSLVTAGIYRYTRNPMYVGMTMVLVGVAAWLWWLPALLAAGAFALYITQFQIKPEERTLLSKFGQEYEQYCQSVRRWL